MQCKLAYFSQQVPYRTHYLWVSQFLNAQFSVPGIEFPKLLCSQIPYCFSDASEPAKWVLNMTHKYSATGNQQLVLKKNCPFCCRSSCPEANCPMKSQISEQQLPTDCAMQQSINCSQKVCFIHLNKMKNLCVFRDGYSMPPCPLLMRENAIVEKLLCGSVNFQSEIRKHQKIKDMDSCNDKRHPCLHSLTVNSCLLTHCG